MNSHKGLRTIIFGLLLVFFSTIGCATFETLPFISTATPYPTYTPAPPTSTPIPERWSVKVISAIKALTFGDRYYTEDQKSEFLIITIEYTYNGQDTTEFSPQSVILLFPDNSSYPGAAFAATDYQAEGYSTVTDFATQAPILAFIRPGQTKTEKFGWGLPSIADTKYRLLFPETKPIDITVDNR